MFQVITRSWRGWDGAPPTAAPRRLDGRRRHHAFVDPQVAHLCARASNPGRFAAAPVAQTSQTVEGHADAVAVETRLVGGGIHRKGQHMPLSIGRVLNSGGGQIIQALLAIAQIPAPGAVGAQDQSPAWLEAAVE